MTAPSTQLFFESPLIQAQLDRADSASVHAAALALADRYTSDVSRPAMPRFSWVTDTREMIVAPDETQPFATSPGNYWIVACCLDPGDGAGGLLIEDPRTATAAFGVPGLAISANPPVEIATPAAGGVAMFQGFLRHGFHNPGAASQHWVIVALRAKLV